MADDKQDRDAAKAYEAAAGKTAEKAQTKTSSGVKPADDSAKKAAPSKAAAPKASASKPKPPAARKPAKRAAKKQFPAKTPAPKKDGLPKPAIASEDGKTPSTATVALMASDMSDAAPPSPAKETAKVKQEAPAKADPVKEDGPAAAAKPTPEAEAKPAHKADPAPKAEPKPASSKPETVSQSKEKAPLAAKTSTAPAPEAPAKSVQTPFKPADKIQEITQEFVKMTDAEMMTKSFQNAMAEMSAKSQDAYRKSTEMFKEAGEFTKGNLEAMMESSKIFASGMQEMSRSAMADSKAEFEELTAEVKEMAAVKSPTDFFQLQSALLRKNFDKAVAMSTKNTEAMLKLANEASQPLSSRMSLAMEKIKAA